MNPESVSEHKYIVQKYKKIECLIEQEGVPGLSDIIGIKEGHHA